jgi:1,4-dihydroxy-2-naphthoate octaprenyltransferase
MGYAYTAGPFPLAYKGLGDLFVILFFGLVAVGGMFYLQAGDLTLGALILGLQVGFHATVLIAINNLRDVEGDRKVNKRTLAVRFGKKFVRKEIWFLLLAPFILSLYWGYEGHFWAFLLPWSVLPLALKLGKLLQNTEPSPEYNKFLGQAAGIHLLFGIFTSVGFYL